MTTAVRTQNGKKHSTRHHTRKYATKVKMPRNVMQQLEKIYVQSRKQTSKHPYKLAGGVLLSLGLASGAYWLVRYLRNE